MTTLSQTGTTVLAEVIFRLQNFQSIFYLQRDMSFGSSLQMFCLEIWTKSLPIVFFCRHLWLNLRETDPRFGGDRRQQRVRRRGAVAAAVELLAVESSSCAGAVEGLRVPHEEEGGQGHGAAQPRAERAHARTPVRGRRREEEKGEEKEQGEELALAEQISQASRVGREIKIVTRQQSIVARMVTGRFGEKNLPKLPLASSLNIPMLCRQTLFHDHTGHPVL